MKVLITGGYGFIGSHAAEYFKKEGHDVYIIDSLSNGNANKLNIKHKYYQLDVNDDKCEEVFSTNLFDAVVHLATNQGSTGSDDASYGLAQINVLGLVHMLNLSRKYKVRKFIHMSSTAVYGEFNTDEGAESLSELSACSPVTPFGVSKLAAEAYCRLFRDKYGMDVVSLRIANAFGPRQFNETSPICRFSRQILTRGQVNLEGNGEQTSDFVYVGDVVDAIYKAASYSTSPVINISSNKEYTFNEVLDVLRSCGGDFKTVYDADADCDYERHRVSNALAVSELNWVPIHSLESGIQRTFSWYEKHYDAQLQAAVKEDKKENLRSGLSILKPLFPYVENLLVFMIVVLATGLIKSSSLSVMVDLRLLYIIVIGIHYGLKQSTIAVFLACGHFLYELMQSGQDILTLVYNVDTLIYFSMYIFIGSLLGYTVESRTNAVKEKEAELREMKDKFSFLYDLYSESKEVRQELHAQIISSEDSFLKIYDATSRLDTLQPGEVFSEAVSVVEKIMKARQVAIYLVSENGFYLRLIASSKGIGPQVQKSVHLESAPAIKAVVESGRIFLNSDLDKDLPMMMAPIYVDGSPVALIQILDVDFKGISLYRKNLLKTLTNLVTSALGKAYKYEAAVRSDKYIDDTVVLRTSYFMEALKSKLHARETNGTEFALLRFEADQWRESEYYMRIEHSAREYDVFGVDESHRLHLILSNTSPQEAEAVLSRFGKKGVDAVLISGEELSDVVTYHSRVS